jgi:DNA-binding response OmpR family regulator
MPANILVADDDPTILRFYTRVFAGLDYNVTLAASLAEAASLLGAARYDLLVTDLMLGDGLGTDLAKLFKARFPGAKCLIVTGSDLEEGELEGVDCFPKPLPNRRGSPAPTTDPEGVMSRLSHPEKLRLGSFFAVP